MLWALRTQYADALTPSVVSTTEEGCSGCKTVFVFALIYRLKMQLRPFHRCHNFTKWFVVLVTVNRIIHSGPFYLPYKQHHQYYEPKKNTHIITTTTNNDHLILFTQGLFQLSPFLCLFGRFFIFRFTCYPSFTPSHSCLCICYLYR